VAGRADEPAGRPGPGARPGPELHPRGRSAHRGWPHPGPSGGGADPRPVGPDAAARDARPPGLRGAHGPS
jgi:hypothetical protein